MGAKGNKPTRSRVQAPWRQALWYDRSVKPTVYIETSVVSYYTSRPSSDPVVAANQQLTHQWWTDSLPRLLGFVSAFVLDEATAGDRKAGAERLQALRAFEVLEFVPVITELADDYLAALHLPPASRNDAYHLAMAAWHEMDYLVTWNCRHIASGRVRRIVADINEGREIRSPIICTPEELLDV